MRVLHVLHHSLPVVDGYSLRSSYILRHQRAQGLTVAVVTSAQQPPSENGGVEIDGVITDRTPPYDGPSVPLWREWQLTRRLKRRVAETALHFRPAIIHAHSPVLVGQPALEVARAHHIPFVYEIRDLWENASVDRGKFSERSVWYRLARTAETRVVRRADAVVTICETLRQELATRLPNAARLFVVGNGVETTSFTALESSDTLRPRWNLTGKLVIAYVGTFQPYEGLDLLVRAVPAIVRECSQAHVLIVGGGDGEARLREQVREAGVAAHVTFTGRLPHDEVRAAYAVSDVLVYPRRLTRTTALTTPLKPLEAMAMGKAVVVSDVPAMHELVQNGVTGRTFSAGDRDALAACCVGLLRDARERARLGSAAREWVREEREWSTLVKTYRNVYEAALSRH